MKHKPVTRSYPAAKGALEITPLGHASILIRYAGQIIHVDPYAEVADYSRLPAADLILITHHHYDHLDPDALSHIEKPSTQIIASELAVRELRRGLVLHNGESVLWHDIKITATAAYNIIAMRSPGEPYHIPGQGNGYLMDFGGLKLYIAGDTELIPEMKVLGQVDIAFLPKNLPYTMSDQMFIETARLIHPAYLYPYHYFELDPEALQKALPEIQLVV